MRGQLPEVTAEEIAQIYPDAPSISPSTIEQARDEIYLYLQDKLDAVPSEDGVLGRNLKRAIMNYAIYLTVGGKANSIISQVGKSQMKKVEVGPIKLEKAESDQVKDAETLQLGARSWLENALRMLRLLGIRSGRLAHPGTVR